MDAAGEPLAGAAGAAVEVMPAGAKVTVSVSLKAEAAIGPDLYADVSYPSGWHAAGFEAGAAFGGADRWISLAMLEERPVKLGICLVGENRDNPPTGGELFNLVFTRGEVTNEKAASKAPVSAYNVLHAEDISLDVTDLDVTFEWREKNRGDYDRDGVVAINDITPIAVHFGKTLAQDPDSVDLVDGSGNNRVGIEDITPIAVNFNGQIEGYRIWRSDLAPGQYLSNLQDPARPELSATRPNPDSAPPGRLQYSYTDTAPDDTVTYVFYPYGDGQAGVASDVISPFSGSGDTAPPVWVSDTGIITAELQAGPQIRFTFGKATDADSPPVRYVLYWQEGAGPMNFGTAHTKVYPVADGEIVPYVRLLQASDGVQADTMYSLCVRARDNVGNGTANTNYLTVGGGSPDDFTPPEWTNQTGIISATPGDGQVNVTWGEATDAESSPVTYMLWVEEAAVGIDWGSAPQATYPAGTLAATVSSLTNDVEYEFGIRARDTSVNLNTTTNTNTLMATPTGTPESPYPFGNPPVGVLSGYECTDSAIACDTDNNPVIVSANSKDTTGLNLHYYDDDGGIWVHRVIEANHRFHHPGVALAGEEIYVAAFDGFTGELKLYTGDATGENWDTEVVTSGYAQAFSVSLSIHPPSGLIGLVSSLNTAGETGANDELRYFFRPLAGDSWTEELIDNSQPDCFAAFMYHPQTGEPLVGYGRGTLNFGGGISEAYLFWAKREGANDWTISELPGEHKIEAIDIAADPTNGDVFLALCQIVVVTVDNPPEPPQDYNGYEAVVARYSGGSWTFELAESATWYPEGEEFIHLEFEGADPQVSFRQDGRGRFVWVHIDMVGSDMWDTVIPTNLEASSYDTAMHTWSTGLEVTGSGTGASAVNMQYVVGGIKASYAQIPELNYFTLPTSRNDYPKGDLAFYRD